MQHRLALSHEHMYLYVASMEVILSQGGFVLYYRVRCRACTLESAIACRGS